MLHYHATYCQHDNMLTVSLLHSSYYTVLMITHHYSVSLFYLQVVWVVTFILTVLLNPDLGLAAAIGFSMLTVIFRTQL